MQITINTIRAGAGANVTESPENDGWSINLDARVNDPRHVKLSTGGDLTQLNGKVSIQPFAKSRMKAGWVGMLRYDAATTADAETPAFPETYWITLFVGEEVFTQTLRHCAMGHLPTVFLEFPSDEIGKNIEIVPKKPNGLTYTSEYIYDDIAWDNIKFTHVAIKSANIGFHFNIKNLGDNETKDFIASGARSEEQNAGPATRLQIAQLIAMVRNVGIGLGILLVILHFVR